MKKIVFGILGILIAYTVIQGICCVVGLQKAKKNLNSYNVKEVELSYGLIKYIDEGEGEVILSVHGIFGGYDQAYENIKSRATKNRIIAPSRFGYLGSSVKGEGTPKEQAEAFNELLDILGIDKSVCFSNFSWWDSSYSFCIRLS
ncbi:MAG: hypothetical protein ACOX6Q_01315 [Candidatus Dojkabacteria bacterium]|jgi:hypothetical protein